MRGLILLLLATVASARLAPLYTQSEKVPGEYIVKLKDGQSVDAIIATLGDARILHKYTAVFQGFAAHLSDRMVDRLRESDVVEFIEDNGIMRANSVASWGLDRIDQIALPLDNVYSEVLGNGAGVHAYVLDTGINIEHEDFLGRSHLAFDAVGGTGGVDCNGHGTHCCGTIAGTDYGVAKAVDIYAVRVLNCFGSGSFAEVISGCNWVASNATLPAVASMSLGGGASLAIDLAIDGMVNAGITVAVAAGNDDHNACLNSPARAESAISVGATDDSDIRAYFSNYGPCVELFAPGVNINSSWIGGPDAHNSISGTSMACPHVAGAIAVILGNNPAMTPAEMKDTLQLKAIAGAVIDPEFQSPNLLLYIGLGSGGGFIPTPPPPTPPPPGCGGYFNTSVGVVTSPNYPGSYDNSMFCSYLIQGKAGSSDTVVIDFEFFSLEGPENCPYDHLTIYDGSNATAPMIGRFCDSNSPGNFSSSGSSMYLDFKTDGSVVYPGFTANYIIGESGVCGHSFTSKAGMFTSPNYPQNYGNHADCTFSIAGDEGETVTISFNDFDVEEHMSCGYDALEIYDGVDEWGDRIANLCGSTIPNPVTSSSNSVFVRFVSDSSMSSRGFEAMYTIQ